MKNVLICLLFSSLFACKDTDTTPESEIVGKWKLVTYCKPSGDKSCNNITVPDNKYVFVEFSNKGQFNEYYKGTIPAEHAFLGCGMGKYELENGDVRIRAMCMSSLQGSLVKVKSISDTRLVLSYFENNEFVFERL